MIKQVKQKIINILKKSKTIKKIYSKYKSYKNKNSVSILQQKVDTLTEIIKDIDWKQNLLMDYYLDITSANKATGALKYRQDTCLDMLKCFIQFCKKNNFSYWLDFGSLLGAIRHKGFIPWDDDIDVAMILDDLYKISKIFNETNNNKYKFIFHTTTIRVQGRLVLRENESIFLDIFGYENHDDYVQHPWPDVPNYGSPIPKTILYPLQNMTFEGITVNVPAQVENYLRIKYGNYNLLPKKAHMFDHGSINEHFIN